MTGSFRYAAIADGPASTFTGRPMMESMKLAGRLGGRAVLETRAARIDQHDAAVATAGRLFDQSTQGVEDLLHRMAARHHFQDALFTGEKSFGPLPVVDIGPQDVPAGNTARGIP